MICFSSNAEVERVVVRILHPAQRRLWSHIIADIQYNHLSSSIMTSHSSDLVEAELVPGDAMILMRKRLYDFFCQYVFSWVTFVYMIKYLKAISLWDCGKGRGHCPGIWGGFIPWDDHQQNPPTVWYFCYPTYSNGYHKIKAYVLIKVTKLKQVLFKGATTVRRKKSRWCGSTVPLSTLRRMRRCSSTSPCLCQPF